MGYRFSRAYAVVLRSPAAVLPSRRMEAHIPQGAAAGAIVARALWGAQARRSRPAELERLVIAAAAAQAAAAGRHRAPLVEASRKAGLPWPPRYWLRESSTVYKTIFSPRRASGHPGSGSDTAITMPKKDGATVVRLALIGPLLLSVARM